MKISDRNKLAVAKSRASKAPDKSGFVTETVTEFLARGGVVTKAEYNQDAETDDRQFMKFKGNPFAGGRILKKRTDAGGYRQGGA